jgi:hypothetical protein
MTISVKGPDGQVVTFPDNTSDDAINQEMSRIYGDGKGQQQGQPTSTLDDMKKAVLGEEGTTGGLRRGVVAIPGIPGSIELLSRMGIDYGAKKLGFKDPETVKGQLLPHSGDYIRMDAEGVAPGEVAALPEGSEGAGPAYKPKTTAGEYAGTISEMAPGAVLTPGGIVRRILQGVVGPGVGSETAGQITKGSDYEPAARVAGAVLGGQAAPRVVTPVPAVSAERTRQANILAREGVDVTAGQATGSRPLRWAESNYGDMPFSGGRATAIQERQGEQFTSAVLRRMGADEPRATQEVMQQTARRLGQQFDDLANRNNIDFRTRPGTIARNDLVADLLRAETNYASVVPEAARAPIVLDIINDIYRTASRGNGIAGHEYNAFRSRLSRMGSATQDPQLQQAFNSIRNALDDAMERVISPQDRAAWQAVRREYKNMKAIEQARDAAGEQTALGLLTPAAVDRAASSQSRTRHVRGEDDLSELSNAGRAIMSPLPNSGTAARLAAQGTSAAALSAGGAMLAGNAGAAAGAVAGVGGPAVMGRVMMSDLMQAYLRNQAMPGRTPSREAIINQLFTAPAQGTDPDMPAIKKINDALKLPKGAAFTDPEGARRINKLQRPPSGHRSQWDQFARAE